MKDGVMNRVYRKTAESQAVKRIACKKPVAGIPRRRGGRRDGAKDENLLHRLPSPEERDDTRDYGDPALLARKSAQGPGPTGSRHRRNVVRLPCGDDEVNRGRDGKSGQSCLLSQNDRPEVKRTRGENRRGQNAGSPRKDRRRRSVSETERADKLGGNENTEQPWQVPSR